MRRIRIEIEPRERHGEKTLALLVFFEIEDGLRYKEGATWKKPQHELRWIPSKKKVKLIVEALERIIGEPIEDWYY